MDEQLQALWNRLRRKIDMIVIVALAVLLGVVMLLYIVEQQAPPPIIPELIKVKPDATPVDWPIFTDDLFAHPKTLEWKPEYEGQERYVSFRQYAALSDFNMFDRRSVEAEPELIEKLDTRFADAERAFNSGDLDTAEQICREIIRQKTDHRNAGDLLRRIDQSRKALEREGTTP